MKVGDGNWVCKIRLYADERYRVDISTRGPRAWRWSAKGKHASHDWSEAPGLEEWATTGFPSFYWAADHAARRLDALQQEVGRWETREDFAARMMANIEAGRLRRA